MNGEDGKEIKCRQALKQGDTLSLFIFTFVVDA